KTAYLFFFFLFFFSGRVTCAIPDNVPFKLQHTRTDGSKYAEMMLQSGLDREKQSEHTLILTAVDGGEPQRSGTVRIHVSVLDANDNAPVFTQSVYKASVLENVLRGTVVARVSAVDADQGYNGNVTYSFTHLEEDSSCPFEINSYTGEIKLTGAIDYEVSPNYELNLQAKDPWGVAGASKLIIEIVDVNDNSPVITMASFSGKISEDSPPGTVVGLISVQDKDSGKNGQVHLTIDENLPFKIKSSLRNYYTLVTEQNLDREKRSKYNITLTATDEGVPALSSRKAVGLEVTDINDNAPAFNQSVYYTQVMENNPPGVALLQIHASDPDQGQNARISYFLIDDEVNGNPTSMYFSINTESGIIQSLRSLDYEQRKEYKIRVKKSGTVNINVRILDANDNAPVFNQSVYKATVIENAPKATYVVTVNASDIDSGLNGQVTYSFSKSKAGIADLFNIDETTGRIYVTKEIDFEKDKKIEFRVEAKDQGGLTDSSKVEIEVIDVNDNAPVINVMSFTSPVSEDSPAGTTIGIINVKDLDSGENGQVRNYYALITDAALDRESLPECNITVVASDAGSPPLSTKRTFNLKVSDVNDNAPVFPRKFYSALAAENNSPGISVLSVNAKDPDENQNARVSYILQECEIGGSPVSEYVSVNAETGVVSAVRSFDYEQIKELVFTVKAQDGGSPPLSSNVTVKIMIQDQNDNPPQVLYPVQTGGSVVSLRLKLYIRLKRVEVGCFILSVP
uniref:Cadherin domain-containing protein n=1 Tax=Stegastes partitus TaxID=144197 RepID=A0A3B4ZNI5_9TELE